MDDERLTAGLVLMYIYNKTKISMEEIIKSFVPAMKTELSLEILSNCKKFVQGVLRNPY